MQFICIESVATDTSTLVRSLQRLSRLSGRFSAFLKRLCYSILLFFIETAYCVPGGRFSGSSASANFVRGAANKMDLSHELDPQEVAALHSIGSNRKNNGKIDFKM